MSKRNLHSVILSYAHNSVVCQREASLFSDPCREEFDEEKEPDGMVLSGWSAPVEKQVNSNGENKSAASSSSAQGTDNTAEDISAKPGMKRKLEEVSETKGNCDASCSAQVVEDDDDTMMLDEDPMLKKKRMQ